MKGDKEKFDCYHVDIDTKVDSENLNHKAGPGKGTKITCSNYWEKENLIYTDLEYVKKIDQEYFERIK